MDELVETTLGGLLDREAERSPDREALVDYYSGRTWTYGEFSTTTDGLAKGLMGLGLPPGAHLALLGGASVEWILTQYAAAKSGLVVVSADPEADADGLAYLLEQSEASAAVAISGYRNRDFPALLRQLCGTGACGDRGRVSSERLPRLERMIYHGGPVDGFMDWDRLFEIGRSVSDEDLLRRKQAVRPEDTTLLSYTSGTTGAPKGVLCTHRGLIRKSSLAARVQNMGPEDRTGLIVPLYHMFGNTCALITALTAGSTLVLLDQSFDPGRALAGLAGARCTVLYGAPSQFIALMEHPDYNAADLSPLRSGIMGGAPCPMEVMKKVVDDMGVSGILVGYGQTEASSWVTLTRPDDPLEVRVSTIGRALPETEVKIVDPRTGEETPPGVPGEMCTRGCLMAGYYRMPAATKKAVDPEGWLHTGDLVEMDERGNCRVMGRIKELIAVAGGEVSPVEIEEALYAHPDVVEAAAFGLPGDDGNEIPAVWIKKRAGAEMDDVGIAGWLKGRLPEAAVPRVVRFTDSFPMTATGKVQKFKMREITLAEMKGRS